MHNKLPAGHHPDTPSASPVRRFSAPTIIGRLALVAVLGFVFIGYLTPNMQIHWTNLMTLCGF